MPHLENPYLGILLSEDLGWSKHIAKTTSKASSTLILVLKQDVIFSIFYLVIEQAVICKEANLRLHTLW
jgi:hypothetical protein